MRRLAHLPALLLAGCVSLQVGTPRPGGGLPLGAADGPAGVPDPAAKKAPDKAKEEAALASVLDAVERDRSTYRISPADLLEVSVYQEKDLDRKVRVSPDGVITMPLAGTVKVAGLGVVEAEKAVTDRLKRFFIAPQVSIFIAEYGNKQIYVLGEVSKPGSYPLPTEAGLTVIEAITLAGGFSQYAAPDRTRIIRKSGGTSANIPIDISAVTKRGDKSKDLQLEPNDVVYVPESVF
ncbi:MAG: polysaccharide export outer membrane protein [Elusimicrobia bacterium]|nr:MAG: polysaccharide export outer membrane protein [Elusimicrobiota bacterium]